LKDKIDEICNYEFDKLQLSDHHNIKQTEDDDFGDYASSISQNYAENSEKKIQVSSSVKEGINDVFSAL
jgi:2-hydroxy-3-keto-5-methylthiopentenyl-1-phosphate phosphatase